MNGIRTRATRRLAGLLLAIIATGVEAQNFSVLYDFGPHPGDPLLPGNPGVIAQGRDGALYSTSTWGGTSGLGTVFKITPDGTLTVLYNFDGAKGTKSNSGLTLGTDGDLYGTAYQGGAHNFGTVFKATPGGTLTVLHDFTNGADGSLPNAPPVEGMDGNWYGSTSAGGSSFGTLYRVTASGGFKTIHTFKSSDGFTPFGPLTLGIDGNFYGTTDQGGQGVGNVIRVSRTGKVKVLHTFVGTDGANPQSGLVQARDGNFYGTTVNGGANNMGAVFKITPKGKFTLLHSFNGSSEGKWPYGGLVQATDGNFYGTSFTEGNAFAGTIYRIDSSGHFSTLFDFDGAAAGGPLVALFQHTGGIPFGDTQNGGSQGNTGTFYRFDLGLGPFVYTLPTWGAVGDTIQFLGQGFNTATDVSFNGTSATFQASSDTFLTATLPAGATTGRVTVAVGSGNLTSYQTFRVTPAITSFNPTSGPVGTAVTITGISLTQTTKVAFGAKSAKFTVNSDTQVTATVPAGAKTGKVTITTLGGMASSKGVFTVTP